MFERIADDTFLQLGREANRTLQDASYRYGRVGLQVNGRWEIPSEEQGKRYITVTMEEGTLLSGVDSRGIMTAGAEVRLTRVSGRWAIDGEDERVSNLTSTNASATLAKHNHNIGYPSFYPIDPASINDGLVLPTGNGFEVTIGRVMYPKSNGAVGIYDNNDTLDLASGVTGLSATTERWVVIYILKTDGTVNFHVASPTTAPANTTTDIEDALADCIATESEASPYHVVRMSAGQSGFETYAPMAGRSMDEKRFIRLPSAGVGGSGSGNERVDAMGNSGSAQALDFSLGGYKTITLTDDCAFTFSNPPSDGGEIKLQLTQDAIGGRTITFPESVLWESGSAPTLSTAANAVDVITLTTFDGGTTWIATATLDHRKGQPDAPSNLTATANGADVDLAWTDNSNNETGFEIYRSTDNVNFTLIDTVAANSTSYTDTP